MSWRHQLEALSYLSLFTNLTKCPSHKNTNARAGSDVGVSGEFDNPGFYRPDMGYIMTAITEKMHCRKRVTDFNLLFGSTRLLQSTFGKYSRSPGHLGWFFDGRA